MIAYRHRSQGEQDEWLRLAAKPEVILFSSALPPPPSYRPRPFIFALAEEFCVFFVTRVCVCLDIELKEAQAHIEINPCPTFIAYWLVAGKGSFKTLFLRRVASKFWGGEGTAPPPRTPFPRIQIQNNKKRSGTIQDKLCRSYTIGKKSDVSVLCCIWICKYGGGSFSAP